MDDENYHTTENEEDTEAVMIDASNELGLDTFGRSFPPGFLRDNPMRNRTDRYEPNDECDQCGSLNC